MRMFGLIASAILSISIFGCKNEEVCTMQDNSATLDTNTYVVVVGMEYSQFAGSCIGCEVDARRMTALFKAYTPNVTTLISSQATKQAVKTAMEDAAKKSELFIFYYSGHGGQQKFWDTHDEDDGMDEFLCLYDTYMKDDEVWSIFTKASGRVFFVADCCHSQTMFKSPSPITLTAAVPLGTTHTMNGDKSILVWSGCPDNTVSYGDKNGGKMTNTLLKYFVSKNATYDYLWDKIETDAVLECYEKVQRTKIGDDFGATEVFR